MNEKNYAQIKSWFLASNIRLKIFMFFYNALPLLVFLSYFLLLVWLLCTRDTRIFKVVLIPFFIFVSVSIVRKLVDRPRPYVVLNIEPLVKKEKAGESFPSRHVLSVSIIAVAFVYINPLLGGLMSLVAILIAIIRVLAGVHYIMDVVFGALISYVLGGLAFLLF